MKIFLSLLSTAAIIICISCNPKTKEPGKNTYSEDQKESLKKLQQPLQAEPSPKEIEAYLEEVKPLREEFNKTLDEMSPGLLKKYLDEGKELNAIKDTSKRQEMMSKMEKKYKEPFMKAWKKSLIADKIEKVNEKYFKKYKWIKGDFGSIIIIENHALENLLPADSIIDSGCPLDVTERHSDCTLIAWGDAFSSSDCRINVRNESHFGGGCGVEGRIGKSFSIPAQYTDITADFTANHFINAISVAFLGGAWATSEVGIKINENGTDKISSAVASITSIAPVIWVNTQSTSASNQHFIASYHRSSSTGNVNVIPKLYVKGTSGAAVFGNASSEGHILNITALKISLHME